MDFTKGEWKAISVPFKNGSQYVVCDGKTIASIKTKVDDAKIMAASAEMYEALKGVSIMLNISPMKELSIEPWAIKVRLALAKANGFK